MVTVVFDQDGKAYVCDLPLMSMLLCFHSMHHRDVDNDCMINLKDCYHDWVDDDDNDDHDFVEDYRTQGQRMEHIFLKIHPNCYIFWLGMNMM